MLIMAIMLLDYFRMILMYLPFFVICAALAHRPFWFPVTFSIKVMSVFGLGLVMLHDSLSLVGWNGDNGSCVLSVIADGCGPLLDWIRFGGVLPSLVAMDSVSCW